MNEALQHFNLLGCISGNGGKLGEFCALGLRNIEYVSDTEPYKLLQDGCIVDRGARLISALALHDNRGKDCDSFFTLPNAAPQLLPCMKPSYVGGV
jgi:hypothetical protein